MSSPTLDPLHSQSSLFFMFKKLSLARFGFLFRIFGPPPRYTLQNSQSFLQSMSVHTRTDTTAAYTPVWSTFRPQPGYQSAHAWLFKAI